MKGCRPQVCVFSGPSLSAAEIHSRFASSSVDVDVELTGTPGERAHAAFLVFIRWAETGAGIMAHTESGDVAFGSTEAEARTRALELTLYEVKAELDAAIERKRKDLED